MAQSHRVEVGVQHDAAAKMITALGNSTFTQFAVKIDLYTLVGYRYLQYDLSCCSNRLFICTVLSKTAVRLL